MSGPQHPERGRGPLHPRPLPLNGPHDVIHNPHLRCPLRVDEIECTGLRQQIKLHRRGKGDCKVSFNLDKHFVQ